MNPQDFDTLMGSDATAPDDLDLLVVLGRVGRARRPGRELALALELADERIAPTERDSEEALLAAMSQATRTFPLRYAADGVIVELRLGLGGLPAAILLAGASDLLIILDDTTGPLALDRETLLPNLSEPPEHLRIRWGDLILQLTPLSGP